MRLGLPGVLKELCQYRNITDIGDVPNQLYESILPFSRNDIIATVPYFFFQFYIRQRIFRATPIWLVRSAYYAFSIYKFDDDPGP